MDRGGVEIAALTEADLELDLEPESGEEAVNHVPSDIDFRAMYRDNVAFVWRNLRRLGVWPSELEDRTQEVFLVAFRRISTFEDRGFGVRAWLFQILLRVASDARRFRRRHPEDATSDLGTTLPSHFCDPCDVAERRQALESLDRALATIDVGRRAVLVLHEIEEMSAPEVAAILEIPVNTVYSRLRVGRAELELALRGARKGGA